MEFLKISLDKKTNSFNIKYSLLEDWEPYSQCKKLQKCWNNGYRYDPNNTSVEDKLKIRECLYSIQTNYHQIPIKNTFWTKVKDFLHIPSTKNKIDAICKEILAQKVELPNSNKDDKSDEILGLSNPTDNSGAQQPSSSNTNHSWESATHTLTTHHLQATNPMPKRDKGKEKVEQEDNKYKQIQFSTLTVPKEDIASSSSENDHFSLLLSLPNEILYLIFPYIPLEGLKNLKLAGNHVIKDIAHAIIFGKDIPYTSNSFINAQHFLTHLYVNLPTFAKPDIIPQYLIVKNERDRVDIVKTLANFKNINFKQLLHIVKKSTNIRIGRNDSLSLFLYLILLIKNHQLIFKEKNANSKKIKRLHSIFHKSLHAAIHRTNYEAVELLLLSAKSTFGDQLDLSPTVASKTVLHTAFRTAIYGFSHVDLKIAQALLNTPSLQPIDINAQDEDGATALHYSTLTTKMSSHAGVKLLLENGANPNIANNDGFTPFYYFCFFGSLFSDLDNINELMQIFSQNHANINVQNNNGETPLNFTLKILQSGLEDASKKLNFIKRTYVEKMVLTSKNMIKPFMFFLENQADPNISPYPKQGDPCLHLIVKWNHLGILKLFIEYGADIDIQNDNGQTALELAIELGNKKLANYLKKLKKKQMEEALVS